MNVKHDFGVCLYSHVEKLAGVQRPRVNNKSTYIDGGMIICFHVLLRGSGGNSLLVKTDVQIHIDVNTSQAVKPTYLSWRHQLAYDNLLHWNHNSKLGTIQPNINEIVIVGKVVCLCRVPKDMCRIAFSCFLALTYKKAIVKLLLCSPPRLFTLHHRLDRQHTDKNWFLL